MLRPALALVAVLVLAAAAQAGETTLADKVREENERRKPLNVPASSPLAQISRRSYLFVAGFLNEGIPGYFDDNVAILREEHSTTAEVFFPSSEGSLSEDKGKIRKAVLDLHERTRKPVVLVGHSKGGAGAVLAALDDPDLLLSGKVDRVVSIQGALGGSPVADAIAGSGPLRLPPGAHRGLESLATRESKDLFRQAVAGVAKKLSGEEQTWFFDRIFYARSAAKRFAVSLELVATFEYLKGKGSGENDGLLLAEDMKLERGVDLGVLEGDHAAFTVRGVLSNTSGEERRAFTRALLREVFDRPDPPRPPPEPAPIALSRPFKGLTLERWRELRSEESAAFAASVRAVLAALPRADGRPAAAADAVAAVASAVGTGYDAAALPTARRVALLVGALEGLRAWAAEARPDEVKGLALALAERLFRRVDAARDARWARLDPSAPLLLQDLQNELRGFVDEWAKAWR